MREIRLSGSEGGAIQTNESLLPLSLECSDSSELWILCDFENLGLHDSTCRPLPNLKALFRLKLQVVTSRSNPKR